MILQSELMHFKNGPNHQYLIKMFALTLFKIAARFTAKRALHGVRSNDHEDQAESLQKAPASNCG
jgi:hypothetical protein